MNRKVVSIALAAVVAIVTQSFAQPPEGFSRGFGISPPRISMRVNPGGRTAGEFVIWNSSGEQAETYQIEIKDIGQAENGLMRAVPLGQGTRSCADWIDVPNEVTVEAGSSRTVAINISVPPGVVGGYYASLQVSIKQDKPREGVVISVNPTLGVSVELRVARPGTTHLEPMALQYDGGASPQLMLSIQNTGVWKKPLEGDILIHDNASLFPTRVSLPFQDNGKPYMIYPEMVINLYCPLPRPLTPGSYDVSVRLRLSGSAQARKEFVLDVSGQQSKAIAREGEKTELDADLAVEPRLIELTLPPGGSRVTPIKILNRDQRPASVTVTVSQVRMEPNGMFTYVDSELPPSWLTVSPEQFTLEAGRSMALRTKAQIPKSDSATLPLLAGIRLDVTMASGEHHDDWQSGGEFPVLVLAQAPKATPATLETTKLKVIQLIADHNPSSSVFRVRNNGGEIARAFGEIVIERRSDGAEIARLEIGKTEPELILPGAEREFRMPIPTLDKGSYRLRASLKPGTPKGVGTSAEELFQANVGLPAVLQ